MIREFEETKAEKFAERLMGMLNEGALAVMISVGHRTRLFDTMSILPPATSEQIADAAGLDERYVREWLAAMTTGRIVEHDPVVGTYWLPPEHAAFLTRAASPNNIAVTTQFMAQFGAVEDDVVAAFAHGGGVPYERYPRFHEVMAEDSGQTVVAMLHDTILPLVPGLTDRLAQGIDVLDLGCGRGLALMSMAAAYPQSRFVGYDLSEEAVDFANQEARLRNLDNVRFTVRDATYFDEVARYDLITTFDAIHDQAKPAQVLRAIRRALRAGGTYLMQDIAGASHVHGNMDHPIAPLLYTISTMHCMSVSLAQGGDGLGTLWGEEQALELLAGAGFDDVTVHQLEHDIFNAFYVAQV
jgi:2-polyprenyl-3-methyl-5-hydroxy-6-metoxy-1,4-benzoquinol methylase